MKHRESVVRGIAVALAVALLGGVSAAAKRRDAACTETSKAARRACKGEAIDDLGIAVGICTNVSNDTARKACLDAADAALKEKKQECGDQFDAREELCDALGQARYDPVINPADYRSPAQTAADPNPYFPLVPGRTWVYKGGGEIVTVTVTADTKVILGVTVFAVRDVVAEEATGQTKEDTIDWFAQDHAGNVWYFGELSQSFENGQLVDTEGSWTAGVDGAKPGIVMKAAPMVGDVYRQEFFLGTAEDAGEVLSVTGSETVPGASCSGNCVVTRDFTPLEPDANENKYYAPNVGMILEIDLETGTRLELVSVTG